MQASSRLESVRKLLQRRGAPGAYIERFARELAEHREDLMRDLLREGMTPTQAETEADRRIGEPAELANEAFEKMRRASFVGRHRVFSLIVMPILLLPLSWFLLLGVAAWGAGMLSPTYRLTSINASSLAWIYIAVEICRNVVPALIGASLYLLARRKFCGRVWSFLPGLVAWLASSILFVHIYPVGLSGAMGRMVIGVAWHFDLVKTVLLVGILVLLEVMRKWTDGFSYWHCRREAGVMPANGS